MLPNHAPLHVAESFRLLEAIHPGRIHLGVGRAPGTDGLADDHPFARVTASPKGGDAPEIFPLGSSGSSAQLAASLGLGFAFASHITPGPARAVLQHYRAEFQPSTFFSEPYAILGVSALAADSDDEAERLAATLDLACLRIGRGDNGPAPTFEEAPAYEYSPAEKAQRRANRTRHTIGSGSAAAARLRVLAAEAAADEVMVLTMAHSHDARARSYELLAEELLAGAS